MKGLAYIWAMAFCFLPSSPVFSGEVDEYVECMSEKQIANFLVRKCPAAEKQAVAEMIDQWKQKGKYDEILSSLSKHGVKPSEMKVNPYRCLIPNAVLNISERREKKVQQEIEFRVARTALEHGLPEDPKRLNNISEREACSGIELALKKRTRLSSHLLEYGIE